MQCLRSMSEEELLQKSVSSVDLSSQLDLVDKLLYECWTRLEMQQDYLARAVELFEKFAKCKTSVELSVCIGEHREYLWAMQGKLLEYACGAVESSRAECLDEVLFVKVLPFDTMVDVLDRFCMLYY